MDFPLTTLRAVSVHHFRVAGGALAAEIVGQAGGFLAPYCSKNSCDA